MLPCCPWDRGPHRPRSPPTFISRLASLGKSHEQGERARASAGPPPAAAKGRQHSPAMPPPPSRAALAVVVALLLAVAASRASGQTTAVVDPDSWVVPADDRGAAGTVEECAGGAARRELGNGGYISYDAMSRGRVPCSYRGASYYNCRPGGPANPYSRGCSQITRCRG
uniref:Rapid alkalinization factor 1 n=2 Tax=Setaria TaxID=4554 RepID=A0A4V6D7K3_SETVI|nr:rapid alkalinization factor-like [Setaria viridis]TKW18696.1 hypothetical protein SEVIR_5G448200v2 [Setaria viridis]